MVYQTYNSGALTYDGWYLGGWWLLSLLIIILESTIYIDINHHYFFVIILIIMMVGIYIIEFIMIILETPLSLRTKQPLILALKLHRFCDRCWLVHRLVDRWTIGIELFVNVTSNLFLIWLLGEMVNPLPSCHSFKGEGLSFLDFSWNHIDIYIYPWICG